MAKSLAKLIESAEKKFGKGETYSPEQRRLILERVVPEWLFRGQKLLPEGELRERCTKAAKHLKELFDLVGPKVYDGSEGGDA